MRDGLGCAKVISVNPLYLITHKTNPNMKCLTLVPTDGSHDTPKKCEDLLRKVRGLAILQSR